MAHIPKSRNKRAGVKAETEKRRACRASVRAFERVCKRRAAVRRWNELRVAAKKKKAGKRNPKKKALPRLPGIGTEPKVLEHNSKLQDAQNNNRGCYDELSRVQKARHASRDNHRVMMQWHVTDMHREAFHLRKLYGEPI